MHKWQEKHEQHCNEMEECDKGKKRLCTPLWGNCKEMMKNEPQAMEKIEEMDDDQDPTLLTKT